MLRYVWHDGFRSVQMSPDVSLPQFVVIGHRQREIEEIEMMVSVLANQKAVLTKSRPIRNRVEDKSQLTSFRSH